jgi:two-component system response regulator PhoP
MNTDTGTLRVHVVEDDTDLREELVLGLSRLGFAAKGFGSAEQFYRGLVGNPCHIALIDVGLPGEDGFSIAGHLRDTTSTGIVLLTARSRIEDRLRGLSDADLYITKPVDLVELAASLCSLARRLQNTGQGRHAPGEWQLRDEDWTLCAPGGQGVRLTASERELMKTLIAGRDKVVARETLAAALGGDDYDYDPHRLEALVSRLRKKTTEADLALPLRAVRGIGYLFSPRMNPE